MQGKKLNTITQENEVDYLRIRDHFQGYRTCYVQLQIVDKNANESCRLT